MAKTTGPKGAGGVGSKALHSRVSFLYQAASYFAAHELKPQCTSNEDQTGRNQNVGAISCTTSQDGIRLASQGFSRRCISHLRTVSLKTQNRLSPALKHSICKRCDIMLINGSTCKSEIENKSKGGRKPWADVLVQQCKSCGYERRFPCGIQRQPRRPHRLPKGHRAGHGKVNTPTG